MKLQSVVLLLVLIVTPLVFSGCKFLEELPKLNTANQPNSRMGCREAIGHLNHAEINFFRNGEMRRKFPEAFANYQYASHRLRTALQTGFGAPGTGQYLIAMAENLYDLARHAPRLEGEAQAFQRAARQIVFSCQIP